MQTSQNKKETIQQKHKSKGLSRNQECQQQIYATCSTVSTQQNDQSPYLKQSDQNLCGQASQYQSISPKSEDIDNQFSLKLSNFGQIDDMVRKQGMYLWFKFLEELYKQIIQNQELNIKRDDSKSIFSILEENQGMTQKENIQNNSKIDHKRINHSIIPNFQPFPVSHTSENLSSQHQKQMSQYTYSDSNLLNQAQKLLQSLTQSSVEQKQPSHQPQQSSVNFTVSEDEATVQNFRTDSKGSNVSNYDIFNNNVDVGQRLMTMGKYYERKKQIKREEVEHQRKNEEDQIVNMAKKKRKDSKPYFSMMDKEKCFQSVEERLLEQKKMYDQKAECRKRKIVESDLSQMQEPKINPKSEKILQNNEDYKMRVEERLLKIGEMWKNKKEIQKQCTMLEIQKGAYPVIKGFNNEVSQNLRDPQLSKPQVKQKQAKSNFEQRMNEHQKKKEDMLKKLKQKYDLPPPKDYKPHPISKKGPSEIVQEFESRQQHFQNKKEIRTENNFNKEQTKFTFTPRINSKSKQMVTQSSKERLLSKSPKHSNHNGCKQDRFPRQVSAKFSRSSSRTPTSRILSKESSTYTFKPQIDENSKKIDSEMNQTVENIIGEHNVPRWELLYQRFKVQAEAKKEFQHRWEVAKNNLEKQDCTFQPELIPSSREYIYQTLGDRMKVYERNLAWQENKQSRINQMNEQKEREEFEHCTFQPFVTRKNLEDIIQADYSKLNTKAIEKFLERQNLARKQKHDIEEKEQNTAGSGHKWSPKLTKPQAPTFMRSFVQSRMDLFKPKIEEIPFQNFQNFLEKEKSQSLRIGEYSYNLGSEREFQENEKVNLQENIERNFFTIPESEVIQEQSKESTLTKNSRGETVSQTDQTMTGINQEQTPQQIQMRQEFMEGSQPEYRHALNFLHHQLHKIDFSFDQ